MFITIFQNYFTGFLVEPQKTDIQNFRSNLFHDR